MNGPWAAIGLGAGMGLLISALGAGGSLFIIPMLLIVFHEPVSLATGTSLVVVFAAACVGACGHYLQGKMRLRVTIIFGSASMAGAALGAYFHTLVSADVVVTTLSFTLAIAAIRMLLGNPDARAKEEINLVRVLPLGFAIGMLTGFVGVGGGFLMVPALVYGAGLGLHDAIGTSCSLIAMTTFGGAITHIMKGNVDLHLALEIGGGAILGALLGAPLSGKLPERPLKVGFSIFVLATAVYVFFRGPS